MAWRSGLIGSVLLSCIVLSSAFNITTILDGFPNFSQMNALLSSTGVAGEINAINTVTVLAVSNDALGAFTASNPNVDAVKLADLLRYHVLLDYYGLDQLQALDTTNYTGVTTLYQSTGRANGKDGVLNIYNLPTGVLIGPSVPGAGSNATVVTNITAEPFNISVIQISSVLTPVGFNASAGDLIEVLRSFNEYTLFIQFLQNSDVDAIFAGRQNGAGITVFAPKDSAFNKLAGTTLQNLTVSELKLLMQYHALTSYFPLDILKTLVEVTTISGTIAPGYKLNVSASGDTVSLHTGVDNATIVETLFDARPTSMFGIDSVLLPPELFEADALAPTPAEGPSPDTAPGPDTTSPPTAPSQSAPGPADGPPGSDATGAKFSVAMSMVAVIASSFLAAL